MPRDSTEPCPPVGEVRVAAPYVTAHLRRLSCDAGGFSSPFFPSLVSAQHPPAAVRPSSIGRSCPGLPRGSARAVLASAGWKVVLAQPRARALRRHLLSAYDELGHGDRPLPEIHDRLWPRFAAKDSLFRVPFLDRCSCAGAAVPVNRRRTDRIHRTDGGAVPGEPQCSASPSRPRGRGSRTEFWKSGFYHPRARRSIAPLALGYIDYPSREIGVGGYLELTERRGDRYGATARFLRRQARPPSRSSVADTPSRRGSDCGDALAGRCGSRQATIAAASGRPTMGMARQRCPTRALPLSRRDVHAARRVRPTHIIITAQCARDPACTVGGAHR